MIIEFIGLMSAGKTTLHRRAVQRLDDLGRVVWTPSMLGELCGDGHPRATRAVPDRSRAAFARLRRLAFRLRAAWWSRTVVSIAVRHLLTSRRPLKDKLTGFRWFLTSLGNYWKAHLVVPPDDIVMIDEGLAQRMFNIFIHGCGAIDLAGVKDYARSLPLPDVLIYLVTNSEVAARRTQARTKGLPKRFRSLNRAQLSTVFANAARALDVLVEELQAIAARPLTVIVIETGDLGEATMEFDAHIDALLPCLQQPPSSADDASVTGHRVLGSNRHEQHA